VMDFTSGLEPTLASFLRPIMYFERNLPDRPENVETTATDDENPSANNVLVRRMKLGDWIANELLLGPSYWMRYTAAGLFTLLSIFVITVLWRQLGVIADPGLLLLFTVAASTFLAGGMAGMLSAAIVLFCSLVLFSHPLYPFRYSELDWRQMMVISIASPLIALMVGSLREQVDRLKAVSREADSLRGEVRRLEFIKDEQYVSEQRFRAITESLPDYSICTLDAKGLVKSWNPAAERLVGYTDLEIMGQSYSRFFTREDLLVKHPEKLLELTRIAGRAEEQGWRVRKGGGRFNARVTIIAVRNSYGDPAGFLMVIRDLSDLNSRIRAR
jgi:PAS domain S-box-containing protein